MKAWHFVFIFLFLCLCEMAKSTHYSVLNLLILASMEGVNLEQASSKAVRTVMKASVSLCTDS